MGQGLSTVGKTGPQGPMGPRGLPGESIIGPRGPPGESIIGPPGESIIGPRGPPGESIKGDKGDKGDSIVGPAGQSITGPQGPQGNPGVNGEVTYAYMKTNSLWCADGGICSMPSGKPLNVNNNLNVAGQSVFSNIATFNSAINLGGNMNMNSNGAITVDAPNVVGGRMVLDTTGNLYVGGRTRTKNGLFTGTNPDVLPAAFDGTLSIKNSDGAWSHFNALAAGSSTDQANGMMNFIRGPTQFANRACINGSYCICKNPNNANLGICQPNGTYIRDFA